MIGRRRDLTEWSWTPEDAPQPGDYGKQPDGDWYAVTPSNLMANLNSHEVVEHEDNTITVSPSILVDDMHEKNWHGYLERGVWREV
jgi:hypothetical protein